jgi:hypothetical protein
MITRKNLSFFSGLASLFLAACGGVEMDQQRPMTSGPASNLTYTALEQRGFNDNLASSWSSCSSVAGPGNMAGHNCAAAGSDIKAGTAPLINTTFTYPDTAPDGTANAGLVWMGTDADGGFANAYWFTQLNPDSSPPTTQISTFSYSMDIYVGNPDGSYRAIEWDGNWFFGGQHYDFGLQNERNAVNTWRFFDFKAGSWVSTGVPSTNLSGGWHHVQANFSLTASTSELVSFQIDGGAVHSGNGAWISQNGMTTGGNKATMGLQGDELMTGMSIWYKNIQVVYN